MLLWAPVQAAPGRQAKAPGGFSFAVIGNVPERPEDVAPARALLDAIDAEHPAFVVHLGNLKGRDESCA
ncbi:MAG: hypothetical protein ACRC1O_19235, partial [Ralstonia mannitolilytica]